MKKKKKKKGKKDKKKEPKKIARDEKILRADEKPTRECASESERRSVCACVYVGVCHKLQKGEKRKSRKITRTRREPSSAYFTYRDYSAHLCAEYTQTHTYTHTYTQNLYRKKKREKECARYCEGARSPLLLYY